MRCVNVIVVIAVGGAQHSFQQRKIVFSVLIEVIAAKDVGVATESMVIIVIVCFEYGCVILGIFCLYFLQRVDSFEMYLIQ